MKRSKILARRYARALFLVGKERNILEKLREDMTTLVGALKENREFYHFFLSPEVPRSEKEQKIEELFGDIFSNVFYNFVLVLLKKRRQGLIFDIAEAFGAQLDIYHNRVRAYLTSAVPLDPELQEEVRKRLSEQLKKEIILVPRVDPDILGGILISIDGVVIDGSLRGQLKKLREYLLERTQESVN
ncbi:MAG TPA: ATP synthase F1 subunit delta [Bacteroidetes bacterium]|nr:ATP synthase F1 subunit delta [Bacteroidota bacterium]